MKLVRESTIWLPTSYDATPVTQKNNRKLKPYLINPSRKRSNATASKGVRRVRPHDMTPFTVPIDDKHVDALVSYHLTSREWNKILHLKPYYSFDPKSMANVLGEFKREMGKMEGKRKEYRPSNWKGKKASLHAIIEFGDKLHGIHAHALVRTWLTDIELDAAWVNANEWGTLESKIKLENERILQKIKKGHVDVLNIDKAVDAWRAVRYVVGNEIVYSAIDDKYVRTNYANDLVCKMYGRV